MVAHSTGLELAAVYFGVVFHFPSDCVVASAGLNHNPIAILYKPFCLLLLAEASVGNFKTGLPLNFIQIFQLGQLNHDLPLLLEDFAKHAVISLCRIGCKLFGSHC